MFRLSGPSRFGWPPARESSKPYLDELGISTLFYPLLLHRLKKLFGPIGNKKIFITFVLNPSRNLFGPSRFGSPPFRESCKAYLDKLGISTLFYPLLLQRLQKLFGPICDRRIFITFLLNPSKKLSGPSRFGSAPVRESSKAYLDEMGINTLSYPLLLHRLKTAIWASWQ